MPCLVFTSHKSIICEITCQSAGPSAIASSDNSCGLNSCSLKLDTGKALFSHGPKCVARFYIGTFPWRIAPFPTSASFAIQNYRIPFRTFFRRFLGGIQLHQLKLCEAGPPPCALPLTIIDVDRAEIAKIPSIFFAKPSFYFIRLLESMDCIIEMHLKEPVGSQAFPSHQLNPFCSAGIALQPFVPTPCRYYHRWLVAQVPIPEYWWSIFGASREQTGKLTGVLPTGAKRLSLLNWSPTVTSSGNSNDRSSFKT